MKIKNVEDHLLLLSFICPETGKTVIKHIDKSDIDVDYEKCHICGSHIKIYLDMQCESCKKWHKITLRDDSK